MINRTIAAGIFIFCIGYGFASGDVAARSGGMAGRPVAVGAPRVGALPLVKPGQIPAINPAVAGGFPVLRRGLVRRHHRFFRNQLLPYGDGVYQPYLEPNSGVGVEWPGSQTMVDARPVPPGEPVVVNGRICFAQPYLVPSEAGGTRNVTVTRC